REVLEERYRPKNSVAMAKLAEVFLKPEREYFANWQEVEIEKHDKVPIPGELHLGPLFGDSPGAATYINEPFLNAAGRKKYREALLGAYDELQTCAGDFDDDGRIKRIGQCITNAVADIDTLILGKGQ